MLGYIFGDSREECTRKAENDYSCRSAELTSIFQPCLSASCRYELSENNVWLVHDSDDDIAMVAYYFMQNFFGSFSSKHQIL